MLASLLTWHPDWVRLAPGSSKPRWRQVSTTWANTWSCDWAQTLALCLTILMAMRSAGCFIICYTIFTILPLYHNISGCLLSAACLCVEWLYEIFYARMWHRTRRLLDWRSTFTRFLLVWIAFMVVTEIAHSWSSVNKTKKTSIKISFIDSWTWNWADRIDGTWNPGNGTGGLLEGWIETLRKSEILFNVKPLWKAYFLPGYKADGAFLRVWSSGRK